MFLKCSGDARHTVKDVVIEDAFRIAREAKFVPCVIGTYWNPMALNRRCCLLSGGLDFGRKVGGGR